MNFIVVDDNSKLNKEVCNIITKIMIKNDLEYHIYPFFDYDTDFIKLMNDENIPNKVYILDMMCPSATATEIARKIRKFDYDSLLIFMTFYYDDFKQELLEGSYMFLKFVNKKKSWQKELEEAIEEGIVEIKNTNIVEITSNGLLYRIPTKDILYVYYEERHIYVVTQYRTVSTLKPLKAFCQELGNNFKQSHKACFVNTKRIDSIDKKNRIIYFNQEKYTNLVSAQFLREILHEL